MKAPFRVPPGLSAARRASSAPATVASNAQVKLTLPLAEGVVWETSHYTLGDVEYEYVVAQQRLRQTVNDKGENEGEPSTLGYHHDQAHGSYALINFISFENVGINQLKKINAKWPPQDVAPNAEAFLKFLRARKVPNVGTLENLLAPPRRHANGWIEYGWTAFVDKELPAQTKEGLWKDAFANYQIGWHGTKMECLYKTMIDGRLSEHFSVGRRIKDGKTGVYMMKNDAK